MNLFTKILLIVVAVIYFIMPDIIPGPIDDIILLIMAFSANTEKRCID